MSRGPLALGAASLAVASSVALAATGPVDVRLASGRTIHASSSERVGDQYVLRVGAATMRVAARDVVSIGAAQARSGALNLGRRRVPRRDEPVVDGWHGGKDGDLT